MPVEAQMPLAYREEGPLMLECRLAGLNVYMTPRTTTAVALHQLKESGVEATSEKAGIRVNVKDLPRIHASGRFELACEPPLDVIWDLVQQPPAESAPVVVTIDTPGTLNLSWPSEHFEHNEPFPSSASAALIAAGIPVVAHPEAWSQLAGSTTIPLPLAHARVGVERYIELTTPAPHKLMSVGIPALFQSGEARYGVPLAHIEQIRRTPGIIWSGPVPAEERAPRPPENATYRLSPHAQEELERLASEVGVTFGRAVCWSSGLGRRVFALAAIDRLEGWPCTIVTTPAHLWTWHRLAGMFGRTIATTHPRADVRTMLYKHAGVRPDSPASIIFDAVDEVMANDPRTLARTQVYDGLLDPYRIALAGRIPEDPNQLKDMLTLVRPSEFRRGTPYAALYPDKPELRLREHADCYLSVRDGSDTSPSGFPASGTIPTRPTQEMRLLLEEILSEDRDPAAKAAEAMALVSRGTATMLSPKIPVAVAKARSAAGEGRTIAVVSNSPDTLAIIEAMTGGLEGVMLVEAGKGAPPNLKRCNRVLLVDYPQSFSYIDQMVGRLGIPGGPRNVEIIHMEGTTDDRIARLCAIRHEAAEVLDPDRPYSDSELAIIGSRD